MCGILGKIGCIDSAKFQSSLASLTHRGPDDFGIWSNSRDVLLGHRRLSIVDLSQGGHQPMVDESGRFVIVFNGEIYNFVEIKKDLQKIGYKFYSSSDTEVVLTAYRAWGRSCLERFNGMWAFAIWDSIDECLFMSRDRFGKKPLFYSVLPDRTLVFSSEMKALYPYLNEVRPSKDINKYFYNLFSYEHTENCVVDGIKRLPPGFLAVYKNRNLTVSRWWNTLDHLEDPPARYEEQVERWRELFLDAVSIRMRSDVPIGTALSGGLDSSATISAMAYIAGKSHENFRGGIDWQHGFCSHFPGSSLDELKWAKTLSDDLNIPLDTVEIDPLTSSWSINDAMYQVEDPYLTLPIPMLETYRSISQAGIKVTLDGHGADELFSGYGHIASVIDCASPKQLAEMIAIQDSTLTGIFNPDYKNMRVKWLKAKIMHRMKMHTRLPRTMARAIMRQTDWNSVAEKLSFDDESHPGFLNMDPLSKQLYEIFHITILPTLLRNYDRYSMASGVEIRMPFMDWRLVAFTFSLPWTSKIGGGYTKRIMRDALKDILPEKIRTRRDKIGWNAPLHEWFKGPLKKEIDQLCTTNRLPHSVVKSWSMFQKSSSPSFEAGQKMWDALLPFIWKESIATTHN